MAFPLRNASLWLRAAAWLVIALAVLAGISLVYQSYSLLPATPLRDWNSPIVRLLLLVAANLVFTAILASMALLFLWGRMSGSLPELRGWHVQRPESEFVACTGGNGASRGRFQGPQSSRSKLPIFD